MTRRVLIDDLPTNDESVPGFSRNLRADAWLKKASELAKSGSLDAAIKALESAELAMSQGEVDYSPAVLCRLPMYLQEAGRGQEAVDKLIDLLGRYPSAWGKPLRRDQVGMFQGHIESQRGTVYDKLRLVLQREQRYLEAIPYAILAETYRPRIDWRIYKYLAKKWEGKEAPVDPDLTQVKAAGGTFKDYMKEGEKIFEWDAFTNLRESFEGGLDTPKLSAVATLLKKMGQRDRLPELQSYAKDLLEDFKKQDSEVIAEIQVLLG